MRKIQKATLLLFALFLSNLGFTQEISRKYGDVGIPDFTQSFEKIDSTSEAFVLYKKGTVDFTYNSSLGFSIVTNVHVRKRILKNTGVDEGISKIIYRRSSTGNDQLISNISATTYNLENGQIVAKKIDKKSIFDEQIEDNYYIKKLSLPDVKEGSVIEYSYTKTSPINLQYNPDTWNFQEEIPVLWSEFNITIPSHFIYQMILSGYLPLYISDTKNVSVSMGHTDFDTHGLSYHLAMRDIPAFKRESQMTISEDYLAKITFELSSVALPGQDIKNYNTTWDEFDHTLLTDESWGKWLKKSNYFDDEIASFKKIADPLERAKTIHLHVASTIKWNETQGLATSDVKKTYTNKAGSATDINMIMLAMMKNCNLDANPVILSTRNHGKINPHFPLIRYFNYTIGIVYIGENAYLLDATNAQIPFGQLPIECINGEGREVVAGGSKFIKLNTKASSNTLEQVKAALDLENGQLKGTYSNSYATYASQNLRKEINKEGQEKYLNDLKKENTTVVLTNMTLDGLDKINEPIKISYNFTAEEEGINSDIIYLNPMFGGQVKENPFKNESRIYPVDYGIKSTKSYEAEIIIPEGFELENPSKPVALSLPEGGGKFTYVISQTGNTIKVISSIKLNKDLYLPSEYPYLREFYNKIVEKHAEQIVLVKK